MKNMLGLFGKQYGKVKQLDEHCEEATDPLWISTDQSTGRPSIAALLPWLLHVLVIATYSVLIFMNHPTPQKCSPCFSG